MRVMIYNLGSNITCLAKENQQGAEYESRRSLDQCLGILKRNVVADSTASLIC
jgi:hypothetical protein